MVCGFSVLLVIVVVGTICDDICFCLNTECNRIFVCLGLQVVSKVTKALNQQVGSKNLD